MFSLELLVKPVFLFKFAPMINALDLLLQAYINILNTPHKTHKERQLMGNIYTQLCLFGGQPYRIQCEKAKVEYNRAANLATAVQKAPHVTGFTGETGEPEKKNPVKLPENPLLPPKQNEVVAEVKKRGPKPKIQK